MASFYRKSEIPDDLRQFFAPAEMGLESTPDEYAAGMSGLFGRVNHALADDGTLWLNLGDSYCSTDKWGGGKSGNSGKHTLHESTVPSWAVRKKRAHYDGVKPKDLLGIPWRVAFALQSDGWYLRQDIIWHKPNPMPESVRDRCTKAHEYIFLMSKSAKYHYDADAIAEGAVQDGKPRSDTFKGRQGTAEYQAKQGGEGGVAFGYTTRNKRDVWTVTTKPYPEAHFATFPPDLIEPCILAGCPEGGIVLDPFGGSGTTAEVAHQHRRGALLIELSAEYFQLACKRVDAAFDATALIDPTPPATVSPGLFDETEAT